MFAVILPSCVLQRLTQDLSHVLQVADRPDFLQSEDIFVIGPTSFCRYLTYNQSIHHLGELILQFLPFVPC